MRWAPFPRHYKRIGAFVLDRSSPPYSCTNVPCARSASKGALETLIDTCALSPAAAGTCTRGGRQRAELGPTSAAGSAT
eukprot:2608429-Pyramimonas_sp.AAC.1